MIEYRNVHKAFDVPVLSGVDLTVETGEMFALFGPSGTGKSVLLKTTIDLICPDKGDVRVDGESVYYSGRGTLERVRRKVGYVFQYAALFDSLSVRENVLMGLPEEEVASTSRTSADFGAVSGITSQGTVRWDNSTYTFFLSTVVHGPLAVQTLLWTRPGNAERAREAMRQGAAALEIPRGPMLPSRIEGSVYVDERMGFSFLSPWSDATPRDTTPVTSRAVASIVSYSHDRSEVIVYAVTPPASSAREEAISEMLMQILRERIGHPLSGDPTESEGTLAGRPCTVMRWSGLVENTVVHSLRAHGTNYGVMVTGPSGAQPSPSHIIRGFRLLE